MKNTIAQRGLLALGIAVSLLAASCTSVTMTPAQSVSIRAAAARAMPGNSFVEVSTSRSMLVVAVHLLDSQLAGEDTATLAASVRNRSARIIQSIVQRAALPAGTEAIVVDTYHGPTLATSGRLLYSVYIPIRYAIAGKDDIDIIKSAWTVEEDAIPQVRIVVE